MKVKAYAKINFMLDITGKRENGYHSLFMIMQSVDVYDTVSVEVSDGDRITLTCSEDGIPCDEKNTAYKAAKYFLEEMNEKKAVSVHIEKAIPHEAGLAGGSADAAAVIYALNALFGEPLDERALTRVCLKVGSDVPFCLKGGTCLVQNIGDAVSVLPNLSERELFIVLCKPPFGVSTPAAYADYDAAEHIRHLDRDAMLGAVCEGDIEKIAALCDNVFEQVVDVPSRAVIKGVMRDEGCLCCCMSGSGPTVYGVFADTDRAKRCAEKLLPYGRTFVCRPADRGVE